MSRHVVRARAGESRANLYDEITDKIITELEAGRVPWVHPRHDGDAILMLRLHLEKNVFRMIRQIIDVHALVVLCAGQHQVVQVSGERWRTNGIAAWPVCTVGHDMRDEAKLSILTAGDQVTDEILVASAILAASPSLGPESDLNFAWDLRFCHGGGPIRLGIVFTFYPKSSTARFDNPHALPGLHLEAEGGQQSRPARARNSWKILPRS